MRRSVGRLRRSKLHVVESAFVLIGGRRRRPKNLMTEKFWPEIYVGRLIFRSFNFSVRF